MRLVFHRASEVTDMDLPSRSGRRPCLPTSTRSDRQAGTPAATLRLPTLCVVVSFVLAAVAHAARFSGEPEIQREPLAPDAALKSFRLDPGLRIELVACEPMIADPVDVCFDDRGRMFVIENNGYNRDPKSRPR